MPLVMVRCKENAKIMSGEIFTLAKALPGLVARHLGEPQTQADLTPDEVEVWVEDGGQFDVNTKDIEVVVWATLYPEREKNLAERVHQLRIGVRSLIPKEASGYVWVLLQPTSYEEWAGED